MVPAKMYINQEKGGEGGQWLAVINNNNKGLPLYETGMLPGFDDVSNSNSVSNSGSNIFNCEGVHKTILHTLRRERLTKIVARPSELAGVKTARVRVYAKHDIFF